MYVCINHSIYISKHETYAMLIFCCVLVLLVAAKVATGSATDMLQLIPQLVTEKDFVVLKFDVDPNRLGYGSCGRYHTYKYLLMLCVVLG